MVWPEEQMMEPLVETHKGSLQGQVAECQQVVQLAPLAALLQLVLPSLHHHKLSYYSICRE